MAYALEDEFGDIIGKARRGQNLSASEIATAAGITEAELARMEQYTLKPTETQVFRLAEVLNLDGTKLLDIATEQWEPEPIEQMSDANLEVITISAPVGGWPVNAYLLICKATDDAAIIDTAAHPELILEQLDARPVNPTTILLTHAHSDHTDGLSQLQTETGCETYIHQNEPKPRSTKKLREVAHSDALSVGELMVSVVNTPGHTPGGCSFLTQNVAFVGDAIFAGSVGGPNISYQDEIESVRDNLLSLPDSVRLFPGHGPSTTVGEEKQHNPFF
ncbi:MBL fold metallo-hydrolase [Candidatus Poribacteria bacterium]|nr:MBL fold metallo-hydrolase [Candidatus Poribacteria bacterium]MYH82874.1 MBL fold metallo-hydrolase [Candidatus Poribacteria bacterium]MYK92488.1 MBL fold metallo-hydrolase [Candidatus Poribacteria bacterium]